MSSTEPRRPELPDDILTELNAGVLIAVEDRLVGRQLARMLTKKGYEDIRAVSNAARALVADHDYAPGIIFVDLDLSDDAYDLARALHRQAGQDPIRLIALMPAIDHLARERVRRAGFEQWLVKPVAQNELDDLLPTLPTPPV